MFLSSQHITTYHHLGRADPKYDAMMCCPWWPCLPCGTAIMYSLMLVGIVLLSTVSLLAGILCCLPWSETQLNQEMKTSHFTNVVALAAFSLNVTMSGHASTATLGFGVAALTIGKQISTKSSFTSPTGGSTAVYQNQKPMQSSCRCRDWSPKRSSRKSTWIMRSTYRLGMDLFLPLSNFHGISSSTGFPPFFLKPTSSLKIF